MNRAPSQGSVIDLHPSLYTFISIHLKMSARTLPARSVGHLTGKVGSPASAAEWPTQPISISPTTRGLEVFGSVLPSSGQVLKQLPPRTALPRKVSASGQKRTGEKEHQDILEHSPVPFVLEQRPSGGLPFKHGQTCLCECVMESPHGTSNMVSPLPIPIDLPCP